MRKSVFCFGLALLVVVACSSSSESTPGQDAGTDQPRASDSLVRCVPEQTFRCLCGLDEGIQRCTAQGELTPCDCTSPPPEDEDAGDAAATCGNGVIDPGEACDDGNRKGGDGCSAACMPDGAPKNAELCPGQPVALWKGTKTTLTGTTKGYVHDLRVACVASPGPDRVYSLEPTEDGTLTVRAEKAPGFRAIVEVRAERCGPTGTTVFCRETLARPFEQSFEVLGGRLYYLFVDGENAATNGAYTLTLDLQ